MPGIDGYYVSTGGIKVNAEQPPITSTSITVTGLNSSTAYHFNLIAVVDGIEYTVRGGISVTTGSGSSGGDSGSGNTTPPTTPGAGRTAESCDSG